MSSGSPRDERGAVAIMVAVLAVILLTLSAMAVDLGNAWARARSVQKQVDVAAISAGSMLPMTLANKNDIVNAVVDYLNNDDNRATGQPEVTATQMLLNGDADGQVYFEDIDGNPCTSDCPQMRVVAPPAQVDFGFAGVVGDGYSGVGVQRSATVRLETPLPNPADVMPFWLPSGCTYGLVEPDTSQGDPKAPTTPDVFNPTGGDRGNHSVTGAAISVDYGATQTFSTGYAIEFPAKGGKKDDPPPPPVQVWVRLHSPLGGTPVNLEGVTEVPPEGTVPLTFTVGTGVTNVPGPWQLFVMADDGSGARYSKTSVTVTVREPATPPAQLGSAQCTGQDRGNFGQLLSPRDGGPSGRQDILELNVALGLDHQVTRFRWGASQTRTDDCGTENPGPFIANAQPDTASISDPPRNCIIGDTGNDGPSLFKGLVSGVGTHKGRLDANGSLHKCPGRSPIPMGGTTIDNDVLSCFLTGSATLAQLLLPTATEGLLDPTVVNSPRFIWLPVVHATDREERHFQPIVDFVPGFITDETALTSATADNGLEVNGNSIESFSIFTFNRAVLPINERGPSEDYDPSVEEAIVRLVR